MCLAKQKLKVVNVTTYLIMILRTCVLLLLKVKNRNVIILKAEMKKMSAYQTFKCYKKVYLYMSK